MTSRAFAGILRKMDKSVEIKKLRPNDFLLAKELVDMFDVDDEKDVLSSTEYVRKMLERNDFHVLIALQNDKLLGGLTAYEMQMFKSETKEMFLYEIEVAESRRREGIGKALIEHLKEICLEKGIVQMFVGTEKDNLPARKLYVSTDGETDEETVWFYYYFM